MNRKKLVTAGLLSFVALSLVVAVADVAGWRRTAPSESSVGVTSTKTHLAALDAGPRDSTPQMAAVYFHATHRCPTCKKIEAYSHEALQADIDSGKLRWETTDYTAPENAAIVEKFKVLTSTVVMVEKRDGQIVRWKNLEEVWDHTHDRDEFVEFMHRAWKDFQENL